MKETIMNKNYFVFIILAVMISLPSFLFSQQDLLESSYIDLETAKKTIARLEKANADHNAKIKELEAANNQMNQEINQHNSKLAAVMDLIENFKKNGLILYEQSLTVIDAEGQKKATEAYEENKNTITRLYAKKMEIENQITSKKNTIKNNDFEISSIKNRIKTNEQEINDLTASMEKTLSKINEKKSKSLAEEQKINEIENQIDSTSKLIEEAERLLE